ncbi:uncharacterized protein [Eurosta solidaginis]|uniref:uncharacterized protein n=1 Tax=Eurosta solidaginis TaxID=178769 RepID=UPI003530B8DA
MQKFYKIKLLLICISAVIVNCEEANEDQIFPLSYIKAISDGKLQRNTRNLWDYLLGEFHEYFDYDDGDHSAEDEKYLICRNCTVVISPSANQTVQSAKRNGATSNIENAAGNPPADISNAAIKPEKYADNPVVSPMVPPDF